MNCSIMISLIVILRPWNIDLIWKHGVKWSEHGRMKPLPLGKWMSIAMTGVWPLMHMASMKQCLAVVQNKGESENWGMWTYESGVFWTPGLKRRGLPWVKNICMKIPETGAVYLVGRWYLEFKDLGWSLHIGICQIHDLGNMMWSIWLQFLHL